MDECSLMSPRMNEIFGQIKDFLINNNIPFYNQQEHTGVVKHCIIRQGTNTDQTMLNIVVNTNNITDQHREIIYTAIPEMEELQSITTCLVTINNNKQDIIDHTNETDILWGP